MGFWGFGAGCPGWKVQELSGAAGKDEAGGHAGGHAGGQGRDAEKVNAQRGNQPGNLR